MSAAKTALFLALILLVSAAARADNGCIGMLTMVSGGMHISGHPASAGTSLFGKDTVTTGDSAAVINLSDGRRITLEPHSSIKFDFWGGKVTIQGLFGHHHDSNDGEDHDYSHGTVVDLSKCHDDDEHGHHPSPHGPPHDPPGPPPHKPPHWPPGPPPHNPPGPPPHNPPGPPGKGGNDNRGNDGRGNDGRGNDNRGNDGRGNDGRGNNYGGKK